MTGKRSLTCAKCGINSNEDSSLTFHRFPMPSVRDSLKAKVWAKFCFPNEDWISDQLLLNLYKQHKMLCGKHFDDSSFTSSDKKRMSKFAIPTEAKHILAELRNELFNSFTDTPINPIDHCVSTSASQYSISTEFTNENKPSTQTLAKKSHKNKGIIKETDLKPLADLTPGEKKFRCRKNLPETLKRRKTFSRVNKQNRSFISYLQSNSTVKNIIKRNRSMICAKCGITSNEDSSLTFHRFPLPSVREPLKAKVWAKFCFPDEDWISDQSLRNLYKQHKMLCGKHFDNTSFTSSDRKRLNKFAIPTEAQHILSELRNEVLSLTTT